MGEVVNFQPTSLSDLQQYSKGVVVQLPDFGDGQPFYARVRRPSILKMAKEGKIPNALISTANSLFSGSSDAMDTDNLNMMPQIWSICVEMAKATLIEPSYDDIVAAGMTLTDQQLLAIFNYTQGGVESLKSFR